jgi:hypothetical protein
MPTIDTFESRVRYCAPFYGKDFNAIYRELFDAYKQYCQRIPTYKFVLMQRFASGQSLTEAELRSIDAYLALLPDDSFTLSDFGHCLLFVNSATAHW